MATKINEEDWLNFLNGVPSKKVNLNDSQSCEISSIEEIYKLASEKGISTEPLDIKSIVTNLFNIEVFECDLDRNISGFIERISGDKWAIYLNEWENKLRKNFTLAHELGHFIKHKSILLSGSHIDQILLRDNENSIIEREASEFAANLLMPEGKFRKFISQGINNLEALSGKFGVTTAAVRYRAYKLKYLFQK